MTRIRHLNALVDGSYELFERHFLKKMLINCRLWSYNWSTTNWQWMWWWWMDDWMLACTDLRSKIFPDIKHWQSPHFFAYYLASCSTASYLGDLLSSGLAVMGLDIIPALLPLNWRQLFSTGWVISSSSQRNPFQRIIRGSKPCNLMRSLRILQILAQCKCLTKLECQPLTPALTRGSMMVSLS